MIPKDVLDRPVFREVASAFNQWMREYIDEPKKFTATVRSITEFIGADISGERPTYGTECALTLLRYLEKQHESGEYAESDDASTPLPITVRNGDHVLVVSFQDAD